MRNSFNLGGFICLTATIYATYYLLIKDRFLPFSVSSVLSVGPKHCHLLAVALVPIFLGLTIFGTAVASIYFGSAIQRWLSQFWLKSEESA